MKDDLVLTHEFVEYIPNDLKDGTIYVSIDYATASHKCCCGCGREVVTPLSPTDWTLMFNGESISLDPSIGNWSFPCRSHYWIKYNKVKWSHRWSQEKIDAGRAYDSSAKQQYFEDKKTIAVHDTTVRAEEELEQKSIKSLWRKLKEWFF